RRPRKAAGITPKDIALYGRNSHDSTKIDTRDRARPGPRVRGTGLARVPGPCGIYTDTSTECDLSIGDGGPADHGRRLRRRLFPLRGGPDGDVRHRPGRLDRPHHMG